MFRDAFNSGNSEILLMEEIILTTTWDGAKTV